MASFSDLPRASSDSRLRERDHFQDLLRWAISRFARLQDVTGDLANCLSTVSEMETSSKQRMEDMGMKMFEMVNGIVGLSVSVRHVSEETSKNHRAEVKHLENISWQLAGSGKNINTSLKETITSLEKIMSQVDNQVTTQTKNQEETNKLLSTVNLRKLIDLQGKKSEAPKSSAAALKFPTPPSNVVSNVGTGSTVPPAPLTPAAAVQPKLMPVPPQSGTAFGSGPVFGAGTGFLHPNGA